MQNQELLISGARNTTISQKDLSNYDANMPYLDKSFSARSFEKYILASQENFNQL